MTSRRNLLLSIVASPMLAQKTEAELIEKIRKELVTLPYYGCFDFLTFKLEGTVVTLGGYAMRPTLKEDAERAIKDLERISKIENQIEVLPLSPNDDQIRWAVFRTIYRDAALSRYAPGGGFYGGPFSRHRGGGFFGGPFERWSMPANSSEPLGSYPIHIIVKNGNVVLVGIVDNKGDSDRANILANGVSGVFNVKNLLEVDPSQTSKKKK
ncbi:BON domain-containing protein [Bryobacter aggregatus]|uniref:BON domain-containing protein n=1 Tax=Bryobacter aggregatus TaxID=360054 RepID=UPI000567319A|nr:BON domain-containing protein [Bryobacter aggregatus]